MLALSGEDLNDHLDVWNFAPATPLGLGPWAIYSTGIFYVEYSLPNVEYSTSGSIFHEFYRSETDPRLRQTPRLRAYLRPRRVLSGRVLWQAGEAERGAAAREPAPAHAELCMTASCVGVHADLKIG
jgi:hypothetical protein